MAVPLRVTIYTDKKDAAEAIEFLDEYYDRTHDAFFNMLANAYRKAIAEPPRPDDHSYTQRII